MYCIYSIVILLVVDINVITIFKVWCCLGAEAIHHVMLQGIANCDCVNTWSWKKNKFNPILLCRLHLCSDFTGALYHLGVGHMRQQLLWYGN